MNVTSFLWGRREHGTNGNGLNDRITIAKNSWYRRRQDLIQVFGMTTKDWQGYSADETMPLKHMCRMQFYQYVYKLHKTNVSYLLLIKDA